MPTQCKYCPGCGKAVISTWSFCGYCGDLLDCEAGPS